MRDSNHFPKGTIWVIRITAVTMIVLSYLYMCHLGANLLWCIIAPLVTTVFFYLFIYMMRHSSRKKRVKFFRIELPTLFIGLPTWLVIGYVWEGVKLIGLGFSLHEIGTDSGFWSNFVMTLTISTVLNFFGNLIVWHLGGKQWVHNTRKKIKIEVEK